MRPAAPIWYECDTCHKIAHIKENRRGITTFPKCVFTNGCVGTMRETDAIGDARLTETWAPRRIFTPINQPTETSTWICRHNLGGVPLVNCWISVDGGMSETTDFSMTIVDENTCTLRFNKEYAGTAHFTLLASSPTNIIAAETNPNDVQITTSGVLTFAAVSQHTSTIKLLYENSNTNTVAVEYTGIKDVSSTSPWVHNARVIVNGKLLYTKSVHITESTPGPIYFSQGAINNGATVTFDDSTNSIVLLLAKSPYTPIDRIVDKCVRCATISTGDVYFFNGELYAPSTVITSIYPAIMSV